MGIFDDESEDEVKISPSETGEENTESQLRNQVEDKVVNNSTSGNRSNRGKEMREKSTGKTGNEGGVKARKQDIGLKDIHRQNKKIIELLEEISGSNSKQDKSFSNSGKKEEDNEEVGDFNGVL